MCKKIDGCQKRSFFFKKGIFLYKGNVFKTKEEESEEESENERVKKLSNMLRMNQRV